MAKNTYFISIHIGKFISAHFEQFYCFRHFLKISKSSQTYSKWSQKVPKLFPHMSKKSPKNVRKVSGKCPKSVRKISEKCPKHLQNYLKKYQKYGKESLSVEPRIEPGTLRIQLPDRIRLPAHWANPVTRNRVSRDFLCIKIREKTARNNLVAEKAFFKNRTLLL